MSGAWMQIIGLLLVLVALLDVFLTALVTRIGTSIISERVIYVAWLGMRFLSRLAGRYKEMLLGFAGPIGLLLIIIVWIAMLICGFALMARPSVGKTIIATSGPEPPNQMSTAVYVAGTAISTAGSGTVEPHSNPTRWLVFFASLVGISIVTLTLTYLVEVYGALLQRNSLAMSLHFATANTGDAAEWIAHLGAAGNFEGASSELLNIAGALANVYEAHHFYPSIIYFRFKAPHYAIARCGLIVLEVVTLLRTALDERYTHLKNCSGTDQLWQGSNFLLTELARTYLPARANEAQELDYATLNQWRDRFHRAMEKCRDSGIAVAPSEEEAFERYAAMRRKWNPFLVAFAKHMEYPWREIAPADVGKTAGKTGD